ncbi:alpha/beta hydrolase [Sideroxydans lithotrophicus]|uniref:Esterase/lipase/thioesterase family protein n=1 Tax=Sideroxydans lithotrophicus (strain ES-1) TaxID=580332 RepID=D5CPP9_SIDLE|nr:alpha/beta hydrolase [Sideroxydans lithotrophicus]ADE13044.1 esterase/lipase/thioesterase family protein [Sideroxydans lithotrophicus ES-1]
MATVLEKFTTSGTAGDIEGIVHMPDEITCGIAVVAHPLPTMGGTMENKVAVMLAKTFTELGCVALRFNFRGVGASAGEFTGGDGEEQDMVAVVRYAQEQFGQELSLILSGFSFGGYVAARTAQQVHPQHLILAAPAVGRFAMPAVAPDTLVIHGEHDDVVPLADALEWARPQHLPIVVLPQAEHFFHGRLTQLRDIVKRHFNGVEL